MLPSLSENGYQYFHLVNLIQLLARDKLKKKLQLEMEDFFCKQKE